MLRVEIEKVDRHCRIALHGALNREAVERHAKAVFRAISHAKTCELDIGGLTEVDTSGKAALSSFLRHAQIERVALKSSPPPKALAEALAGFSWQETQVPTRPTTGDYLVGIADKALDTVRGLKAYLYLVSDTFIWSIAGARRTQRTRKGAVWYEAVRIGLDALGIVCLIAFLVGTVVALQSASILRLFGADILVADMIGISMTREMAPLMTAIIMAGRSGASIAAEIATMNVNEEISGLRTMGLEPVKYIVVPKFRAITLTMPPLTIFANLCGIFGGFLVAVLYMELGISAFMHQLGQALFVKDILTSLLKSVVFAWIILTIAAHKGFQAYGGADSVGRVTTSSVVASIFWCIVADAIFSLVFYF